MVTMAGSPWLARVAVSLLACLPAAAFADDYADLVAAERAFAADAAARSVRDAFLTALGDTGVVFAPGPVPARSVWEPRPADGAKLEWVPEAAEISASGDLGYTYGPWRFTPAGGDKPVRFGHYFTVWQKQNDGRWRAIADKGTAHGDVPFPNDVVRRGHTRLGGGTAPTDPRPPMFELRQADLLAPGRLSPAIAAADLIAFRNGFLPQALSEAKAFPLDPPARSSSAAVIADAGDLAVTWGGGPRGGSWLRVWRRSDSSDPTGQVWRLAADVSDPLQLDIPPRTDAPKVEAPKVEAPKVEAPKVEAPKADAPKVDAPKVDAPKAEAPKVDAPKVEAPKVEAPKSVDPQVAAPIAETPKVDPPTSDKPSAAPAPAAASTTASTSSAVTTPAAPADAAKPPRPAAAEETTKDE